MIGGKVVDLYLNNLLLIKGWFQLVCVVNITNVLLSTTGNTGNTGNMGNKTAKSNKSETDVSHRAPGPNWEQEDVERVTSFLAVPNSAWALGKEGRETQQEEQARAVKSFIQFENVEKFYEKLGVLGEGAGGKVWKATRRLD